LTVSVWFVCGGRLVEVFTRLKLGQLTIKFAVAVVWAPLALSYHFPLAIVETESPRAGQQLITQGKSGDLELKAKS